MRTLVAFVSILTVVGLFGCERSADKPASSTKPAATATKPADAPPAAAPAGHGGEVIELGTTKIGEYTVRASRDKGEIKAGADAPIDVWITDAAGAPATVAVVRFWIGAADAKGSVKARADIEDPKQPNHFHTHAEIPDPLPADSLLWVELETVTGQKVTGSFPLRDR